MTHREVTIQCRLRGLKIDRESLVHFLLDAMEALSAEGSLGVWITSDRRMAEWNRNFRGKHGPTDVLSFPDGEPDENGVTYLGDLAIGGHVAARAAKRAGSTLEDELRRLMLHGLLHLLGFDHEVDGGKMRRKETRLRKSFGI